MLNVKVLTIYDLHEIDIDVLINLIVSKAKRDKKMSTIVKPIYKNILKAMIKEYLDDVNNVKIVNSFLKITGSYDVDYFYHLQIAITKALNTYFIYFLYREIKEDISYGTKWVKKEFEDLLIIETYTKTERKLIETSIPLIIERLFDFAIRNIEINTKEMVLKMFLRKKNIHKEEKEIEKENKALKKLSLLFN